MSKNKIIWLCIIIVNLILVFLNKSTYDDGDSILHYIQAHQAFSSPKYFMDMWAKPVFILLASPFATFGWWGMQLFNSTCILLSAWLIQQVFESYKLQGWWAVFLSFFAYSFFLVQSSGLTEPLFMLGLTSLVYFEIKDKTAIALIILSFLPFVRSEGYIVGLIFVIYLLFSKQIKYATLVLVGTLIYGIAGFFVYEDFLWMFHHNPYNGDENKYGAGSVWHFVEQLPYLIGLPIFILFALGVYRGGIQLIQGKMEWKEFFLIYGICLGYITAHSIFWGYGLFHSFGMQRVLIVLIPLIAFIAYRGIQWIHCAFHFVPPRIINIVLIIVVGVFPFVPNKMAINWDKQVSLSSSQKLIVQAHNYLEDHNLTKRPVYVNAFYYCVASNRIIDNKTDIISMHRLNQTKSKELVPSALVLWDSYFAPTDAEIDSSELVHNYNLTELQRFTNNEGESVIIYQQ